MKEFVFPSKFFWEKDTYRQNYGKLIIEPLERGYGVTIGNALRRVLLSSIPGVAITGLRIDGVPHEFTTIKGVKEDVTEIVLNLKQVLLKPIISDFPHTVRVEIKGKEEICAEDLIPDGSVEVINKKLKIMDTTAVTLCMENKIPILVFNLNKRDNLYKIVIGKKVGTLIN